jgi:16S rRNA (guanine966-N2)-methyltransferase
MRIVGGRLRGRRLVAPRGRTLRPTSDRAREALFDVLLHGAALAGFALAGATVLDAFAGTGALGLEALSRGTARAFFLETERAARAALKANIDALGEEPRSQVLVRDAMRPGPAPAACDLAFLDPPYGSGLAAPALAALAHHGWLAPGALAVVEHAAKEDFAPPAGFTTVDARRYGAAALAFVRWDGV